MESRRSCASTASTSRTRPPDQKLYKFANFALQLLRPQVPRRRLQAADNADGGGSSADDGNASGAGGSCAVA